MTVKWDMNPQTPFSNHTEALQKIWPKRAAYLAAHGSYVAYLQLLLDRASLPASTWAVPNVTNIAAMVAEMGCLYPEMPKLNAIVLGRFLNRILFPLLRWHGGYHAVAKGYCDVVEYQETTNYRLPEVRRSRTAFERFTKNEVTWSNDLDQWHAFNCSEGYVDEDGRVSA